MEVASLARPDAAVVRNSGSTCAASPRMPASIRSSSGNLSRAPPADQRPISLAKTATAPVAITA